RRARPRQPAHDRRPRAPQQLTLERLDLRTQVREIRLRGSRPADDAREQLRRLERTPPAVYPLAQPLAERAELAALELGVEIAKLVLRTLPELDADPAPERVRGEVAEVRVCPVDVLEHAVEDPGRLDAQVVAELRVERLRQVGGSDLPREHLPLELEAEDDVQRIGDLVGVHADQARRDAVDRAMEVLERHLPELLRESLPESRI